MSACVITIPADRIEWGPVLPVGTHSCVQTAKVVQGDSTVLHLTLQWPTPEPTVPVLCAADGRHAGPRD